jgi:sigma-B regulation protein RsbU (phosphoserine phosphatase)
MSQALRIAFADDDPLQGDLLSAWLRHLGFQPLSFSTGDDLVVWAEREPAAAHAVLLDAEMPGRDGVECCRALRTLPAFTEVPIAFVTGTQCPALLSRIREAGARGVIAKDESMLPRLASWLDEVVPHRDTEARR